MLEVLFKIWEFIKTLKHLLITLWFAIRGVLRFVFRFPASIVVFISSLPVWVIPVAMICLAVGFGTFLIGRQH